MREARLQGLEEMAAKLLATARELPPGQDHHNALREIGRFRAQIAALKGADPNASMAASARAAMNHQSPPHERHPAGGGPKVGHCHAEVNGGGGS
jgi:hypothetical protein